MASAMSLSLNMYPYYLISHVSHKLALVLAHPFIRGCQSCAELAEDWRFGNQTSITSGCGLLSDLGQIPTSYLLGGRDNASFPMGSRSADETHHFGKEGNTSVLT